MARSSQGSSRCIAQFALAESPETPTMQLSSEILIDRPPEQVWAFLGEPGNVAKWDRGVAGVEETSSSPRGEGFEFDTVAHDHLRLSDRGRMSYRVAKVDPAAGICVVELTSKSGNARFFKSAAWQFQLRPEGEGCRLVCTAIFDLQWQYCFLAPLLYWKRDAILLDLTLLKSAVETQAV